MAFLTISEILLAKNILLEFWKMLNFAGILLEFLLKFCWNFEEFWKLFEPYTATTATRRRPAARTSRTLPRAPYRERPTPSALPRTKIKASAQGVRES